MEDGEVESGVVDGVGACPVESDWGLVSEDAEGEGVVAAKAVPVPGADAVPEGAEGAATDASGAPRNPGPDGKGRHYLEQCGKGRLKGSKNKIPRNSYGLNGAKGKLRHLTWELGKRDDPKLRQAIRKTLEVISLYYAASSKSGEEFMRSAALAVDLSGFKQERREKIKEQQKRKAMKRSATDEMLRRKALLAAEEKQGEIAC